MKVSVVIPSYKFFRFLEVNLITVLSQKTNFEFEVLVRDDFSQDGSDLLLKRLRGFYSNLVVFEAEENWGFHKNIKFLMEQAVGEYICYLDGDDYFLDPLKLQKQVDFLDANPSYVMHATGYCILKGDSEYIPGEPGDMMMPNIYEPTTEDLLEHNYVGFGRMFRNLPGLYKDYMNNLPYLDYPLNFEISLHGKIKNDNFVGGIYREHFGGVLTALNSEEKEKTHEFVKSELRKRYMENKKQNKSIFIIDCYVHSIDVEIKLRNCIQNLKKHNQDILLISNKIIKEDILKLVDYYVYDSENRLFSDEKYSADPITLYKIYESIEIYEIVKGVQKHGLSVIRNLFKSIKIAKEYGYTHFHRVEVDDIMGSISIDKMISHPKIGFDGVFYFNETDISFHYMYCSIDYFLKNVKEINDEQEYYDYLKNEMKSDYFRNAEEFVRHNLDNSDLTNIKVVNGSDMKIDFPDTTWNTEVSSSNIDSKYKNCTTRLYRVFDINGNKQDSLAVLSYNYSDSLCERKIQVVYESGMIKDIYHRMDGRGFWSYEIVPNLIDKILVFEKNELLYVETTENIESHIVLK